MAVAEGVAQLSAHHERVPAAVEEEVVGDHPPCLGGVAEAVVAAPCTEKGVVGVVVVAAEEHLRPCLGGVVEEVEGEEEEEEHM